MFLKPFRVKAHTALKGSDRKKLRGDIEKQFPGLSCAEVADLIPGKGEMTQVKIITHAEEILLVYCLQKNPIFFELFKKIFPTVYTLWKFPEMLPVFTTYPPVFEKLSKGADLMLPGVEVKGEHHPKMFGKLQKGDLCLVRLKGNRAPVMLGETLLSGEDMYMSAMRGKGVRTIHMLGDHLWEMGDKSHPPQLPEKLSDEDSSDDEGDEEEVRGQGEGQEQGELSPSMEALSLRSEGAVAAGREETAGGGVDIDGDDDDGDDDDGEGGTVQGAACSDSNDPDAMDNLLLLCFKCAIKDRVKKTDLPLLTSNFLKGYMQPYCPPDKNLDLKKSSYKKFSKFLQQMATEGFIRLKMVSRGVDAIVEFDKSHLELRNFEVPDVPVARVEGGESDGFEPPQIRDVLCVTTATLPLLAPYGYTKNSTLTTAELRQAVTDYVKQNTQYEKEQVLLDPILAELALTRSEGDKSYLTWNTLFLRIGNKLQAGYIIQAAGQEPVLRKGKMDPIKVSVEKRGNKKVTIVQNLETFGIEPRSFAQRLQRGVAGSATVIQSEQKNHSADVQVQGSQIAYIAQMLLETYRIPKKFLHGIEQLKAPKGKRS